MSKNDSVEVLKLALEVLVSYRNSPYIKQSHPKRWANGNKAIKAIEEALAKQEQDEPVYHLRSYGDVTKDEFERYIATGDINATPPQRTWVGLTVEEIADCCRESTTTQFTFYTAIEAKLKEKNT